MATIVNDINACIKGRLYKSVGNPLIVYLAVRSDKDMNEIKLVGITGRFVTSNIHFTHSSHWPFLVSAGATDFMFPMEEVGNLSPVLARLNETILI